jgi:hypothetical protein
MPNLTMCSFKKANLKINNIFSASKKDQKCPNHHIFGKTIQKYRISLIWTFKSPDGSPFSSTHTHTSASG